MDAPFGCFDVLASPVDWHPFGPDAFAAARKADQLLFIVLGVSWCPYSHRLLHQLASRPLDAERLNRDFVPILVDTDNRPDLHSRYGAGGWPSIIVAKPNGRPLWRGTHIPFPKFGELLGALDALYRTAPDATEAEPARVYADPSVAATALDASAVSDGINSVVESFDRRYHGFALAEDGRGPKFAQADAINLLLDMPRHAVPDSATIARQALRRLMDHGLWDREVGGFCRYAAGLDWSMIHGEKLLLDNALILSTLCRAAERLEDDRLRADVQVALSACRTVFDVGGPAFAASIRPVHSEVPNDWPIDPLDQSSLVDANAAMLSALLAAARLLDDSWALERARSLADYLCRSAIDAGAVAAHRLDAGRVVAGAQAADTYRLSAALLDAQDTIGVARYGAHAKAIFDALVDRLSFAAEPGALGGVNAPATPGVPTVAAMQQDAGIAAVALRLAEHTDSSGYRDVAMRALSGYQPRDAWGPLAAGYLNVASQYLRLT